MNEKIENKKVETFISELKTMMKNTAVQTAFNSEKCYDGIVTAIDAVNNVATVLSGDISFDNIPNKTGGKLLLNDAVRVKAASNTLTDAYIGIKLSDDTSTPMPIYQHNSSISLNSEEALKRGFHLMNNYPLNDEYRPCSNWGAFLSVTDVVAPFQIYIPDVTGVIYKRATNSSKWTVLVDTSQMEQLRADVDYIASMTGVEL